MREKGRQIHSPFFLHGYGQAVAWPFMSLMARRQHTWPPDSGLNYFSA